jgi:hypothetical protein
MNYVNAKNNPYVTEAVKYGQVYVDILTKCVEQDVNWKSKNFLNDLIEFMSNLIRLRIRNLNQGIMP